MREIQTSAIQDKFALLFIYVENFLVLKVHWYKPVTSYRKADSQERLDAKINEYHGLNLVELQSKILLRE